MSDAARPPGTLRRRDLLTGLGAAALATGVPAQAALSTRDVTGWDLTTDVLIAGSGALTLFFTYFLFLLFPVALGSYGNV